MLIRKNKLGMKFEEKYIFMTYIYGIEINIMIYGYINLLEVFFSTCNCSDTGLLLVEFI